jgi:hypothetical protein
MGVFAPGGIQTSDMVADLALIQSFIDSVD